jgi:hypothetical protein
MNVVLLSPYFPSNFYNFALALGQLGVNVLGMGDTPYEALRPELQETLTEYYHVQDLHDYDELLRACGYLVHRYGRLDRLESHNEYWLETDARLRTDFNIPGPKVSTIQTPEEAKKFIAQVGYPVIAKPDIGVGAAATYKLYNDDDLTQFFAQKLPVDYFMEEFVSGQIYSFDGLTDRQSRVMFCTAHVFNHGVMEVVNQDLDLAYYSLREIPKDLEEISRPSRHLASGNDSFTSSSLRQSAIRPGLRWN